MLVSWDWLSQYVSLDMSIETLTDRLTMSGLNLEEYNRIDDDWVIDLEVTSNRPDCLGHLGIAREVAALFQQELKVPVAAPEASSVPVESVVRVVIDAPDLCSQYHARVIRGVKIGPSPDWMQRRLKSVGIDCVNNVVDITNYVMLECGQPLHAFDADKLQGAEIRVRRAKAGEKFKAINQKEYQLTAEMCVIGDASRPVALAGVMGGYDTEISDGTTNVLIEAALFAPLSVRNTARSLDLQTPSSHRFERALDQRGPEWASRRCCELMLQLAGGELLVGVVSAGSVPAEDAAPLIELRQARFRKVLGIDIPTESVQRILRSLGVEPIGDATASVTWHRPPSFRRDLTREIDLIEEVARVYGYEHLPSDGVVPLCTSSKSLRERVTERLGEALTACGYYEAMTAAFTTAAEHKLFQPHGDLAPLYVEHSTRKQENLLRQSLVPSLLACRRANERQGNFGVQLFEVAKVYLAANPDQPEMTVEPWMIGLVTPRDYLQLKGVVESLAGRLNRDAVVRVVPSAVAQFTPGRGAEVLLNGRPWGWMGELDRAVCDAADLRDVVCVAELRMDVLEEQANLVPRALKLPDHPSMVRDLNFVLDEAVPWAELEAIVRQSAGPLLESVAFGGQYRGKQLGTDKKSYVVSMTFRASDRTLTGEEVDVHQRDIIQACTAGLGAVLRG